MTDTKTIREVLDCLWRIEGDLAKSQTWIDPAQRDDFNEIEAALLSYAKERLNKCTTN